MCVVCWHGDGNNLRGGFSCYKCGNAFSLVLLNIFSSSIVLHDIEITMYTLYPFNESEWIPSPCIFIIFIQQSVSDECTHQIDLISLLSGVHIIIHIMQKDSLRYYGYTPQRTKPFLVEWRTCLVGESRETLLRNHNNNNQSCLGEQHQSKSAFFRLCVAFTWIYKTASRSHCGSSSHAN